MEKIAIVGLSCLFPEAGTPEAFWRNLLQGRDSRSAARDEKFGVPVREYYDPRKGQDDRFYCRMGGYVHDFEMDPTGFEIPAERIRASDDVVQWSLHTAREALKDSGYWGQAHVLTRCGLILGNLSFPTKSSNRLFLPLYHQTVESCLRELLGDKGFRLVPFSSVLSRSWHDGRISGYPAALAAKALALSGPCFALDAACASSLYAVKLACDCLLSRKADMMLAGAVSAADPLFVQAGFSIFQAYPEEGQTSAPLDRDSGGLVAGEGAGIFVLKRYDDAIRNGDRIHAVILGIGLSNDGRGQSVLSPNPKGQLLAFERAYACAGVDPRSIQYVECHATGTPLGDKVELNSMEEFFGKYEASPLVGSVKSNIGHLLTAAGMASMTKVIMSMTYGQIPGTIHLRSPMTSPNRVVAEDRMPTEPVPWPGLPAPKRAGISAFGFGGTNAHLILEQDGTEASRDPKRGRNLSVAVSLEVRKAPQSMAIVGMDAHFGSCEGLSSFHRASYDGTQFFRPVPQERWKGIEGQRDLLRHYGLEEGRAPDGAYLDRFALDFLRLKIPPKEDDRLIPQQLLVLKVADNALQQTDLKPGDNVAVIVAMETELALHLWRGRVNLWTQLKQSLSVEGIDLSDEQKTELGEIVRGSVHSPASVNQYTSSIGNIMASRIAALWDFTGPAFTVSSEESSVFKALEVAQRMLESREVDAVVLGAVDLAGGVESVLWRNMQWRVNAGRRTLSFDRGADGWLVGEGAGALVLKRKEDTEEAAGLVYATVDAIRIAKGNASGSIAETCRLAFEDAGVEPDHVGYVEVSGSGVGSEDEAEVAGLLEAYETSGPPLRCAMGSVKANLGHTFAASGMAGLIRTALCLVRRFLPKTPNWSGPKGSASWEKGPFYVLSESRTWFVEKGARKRIAAVSGLGQDGACAHAILSEAPTRHRILCDYLAGSAPFLFPLPCDDAAGLKKDLDALSREIDLDASLAKRSALCHERSRRRGSARYALAIVGKDRDEVLQEIDAAGKAVERAFALGQDWASLRGSCLTLNPLGNRGKTAFVYTGGYNSYLGVGRDLFHLFPGLYEEVCKHSSRPGERIGERLLYPRSLEKLSNRERIVLEKALFDSPLTMFESGIVFAIAYTKLMRETFRVEPQMAIGYSMGEVSMMYALGVWGETDRMSETLRDSPLFRTRLAGPMDTVREAWGLPGAGADYEKIWYGYALRTSASLAREALRGERQAHLIFINSPNEVVIAGQQRACARVIERLGCEHFEVPMGDAIHCEIARPEYDELLRVHTLPVQPVSGIDFYSADRLAPLPIDPQTIANNIAALYCHEVDFPRLVRQAYQDGARVFVEVGLRENCTNWIREILAGQAHLAVGTNRKGAAEKASIVRALARLYSHRVPLDLTPLYQPSKGEVVSKKSLVRAATVGGIRISAALLGHENRRRFRDARLPESSRPGGREVEGGSASVGVQGVPAGPERPPTVRVAADRGCRSGEKAAEYGNLDCAPFASSPFDRNLSLLRSSHSAFLETRRKGLKQIEEMIRLQMNLASEAGRPSAAAAGPPSRAFGPPPVFPGRRERTSEAEGTLTLEELLRRYPPRDKGPQDRAKPPGEIFDYRDLREFAEGDIGRVFGEPYAVIDTYRRRVRLPMEPYLLVSRVTKLDAETGVFKPCSMTTEYDIPYNAWYSIEGQIPWAVAVESGQCDLWLISYLGIDFESKGERVYRLLDCTLTFLEEIPREGDTLRYDIRIDSFARTGGVLLFFFRYDCYVRDRRVVEMRGGCAGFFTDEELEAGKGILHTEQEIEQKRKIEKKRFDPLLICKKRSFQRTDLVALARGGKADCFGSAYDPGGMNPSLHFTAEPMLMLDRVVSVDPGGGAWGLGLIVAEKDLAPDHWYFPCHFKDDQVLAGSLMADGCGQLLRFYMLYLGLQTGTKNAQFQPFPNLAQKVRCRGQVNPRHTLLTYRMEVKEVGTEPRPYAVADVDILLDEKIVVDFKDLGVVLVEKEGKRAVAVGAVAAREPETLPAVDKEKDALFTKVHLEAFATGSISKCFGPEFSIYEGRKPPRTPNGDLQLISRVLETTGERSNFKKPARVVTEYDVPEDAWFFRENCCPGTIPYSILMEISLQPNGFVSAWMGTTLISPDTDFCFRNLDGEGTLLRPIDLRGKTLRNRSELLSTVTTGNTIIQKFRWALSHAEEPFYEGTAVFGYFLPAALTHQVGLDGGVANDPLRTREYLSGVPAVHIDLKSTAARENFYERKAEKPHYRLAKPQLDFLDEVYIVEQGGRYGQGYVCGLKKIDPGDWFYPCHFYQDPVMPGSLGVESILQALQIYALHRDFGVPFRSPRFCQKWKHRTVWKYRGQIVPTDDRMVIEVHVKNVEHTPERVTVIGDASLWKNEIRIYEVTDAAICLEESGSE